jgi:threonine/homoserine/homoserine lactone efflux protein
MFPSAPLLLGFLATAFTLVAIPGPSVMFIIGRTLSHGRKAGLITVFFNSVGHSTWMLAVAFGLGGFLSSIPAALNVIRIVGALYLGYLGVQSIRHRRSEEAELAEKNSATAADPDALVSTPLWKLARDAYLIGFSNPKVAVFFFAVLPQFVDPGGNFTLQFLTLGIIFEIMGNLGDAAYSLSASVARHWIFARTGRLATIVGIGGVLITSLAVYLVGSTIVEMLTTR